MMGESPTELDLMAYADGELDAATSERMRQYQIGNPRAADKVKLLQQLRSASLRVCQSGPAVPAHLLKQLESLLQTPPLQSSPFDDRGYPHESGPQADSRNFQSAVPKDRPSAVNRHIGFRLATAAMLLIGLGTFLLIFFHDGRADVIRDSPIVPVSWASSTARQHIDCSRHADHFGPGFPRKFEELPSSLRQFIGHDTIVPDLSKFGYHFAGAGPCAIPGGKTAHLLYRPPAGEYTVSLFVQADAGQLPLDKGKVYFTDKTTDHTPMIIWRGEGVLYYLVGEDNAQLSQAAKQMGVNIRI